MIRKFKKQTGVTLIEVLVTLVIMSVALSGIAAMQISSMQSASQVKYRSAAASSAQSILDAMRAGRTGGTATASLSNLQSYIGTNSSQPASDTQAGRDFIDFEAELEASLEFRQPEFEISVDNNRLVTVEISWTQRADAADGTVKKTYSLSAIL